MQGAYGGLIVVIMYGIGGSKFVEEYFLWLDNTPFTLLSGERLTLL